METQGFRGLNRSDGSPMTRAQLLEIAKTTADPFKASWCRTFAANLDLVASDDTETAERGMRMLRFNAGNCEHAVQRKRMESGRVG
jgi:hypothetical protein